jgi:translation initiation factor 1
MPRLFAGTPWDRPPTCDRCGELEGDCACPPMVLGPVRVDPARQTARLRVEKRPKGKVVTVVRGLDADLEALAATLKSKCGTGGTVKDGAIELRGDLLDKIDAALAAIGYKTKRG